MHMRKIATLVLAIIVSQTLIFAQVKTIKGKVTDDQGQPVPYASVKNGRTGSSADENGSFTIKANKGDVLSITGVGIDSKTVTVGAEATLNISVVRASSNLSEVVVTSLGIKREAKSLGYSTATITGADLTQGKQVNLVQGITGKVSGAQVSVINNGVSPSVRIQLRGERHVYAGSGADNQPLIIVDGTEVRSDYLTSINPEDVDNISVMKGASAAALYGSEASNGVMLITTKHNSKGGRPSINVSTNVTIENLAYFPALQTTFSGYGGEGGTWFNGTPYQFTAINPYTGFVNYAPFENQSYGPAFNGNPANGYIGVPNQFGKVDSTPFWPTAVDPRYAFFNTGITTQNSASYSVGDNNNSNYLSVQDVAVSGTMPKDIARRTGFTFTGKRTYGIFSYDYNLRYSRQTSNTTTAAVYWNLLNTPANVPITTMSDWQSPGSWGNPNNFYNAYYQNPYWQIDNQRATNNLDNFTAGLGLYVKPFEWLTASYKLSAQITSTVYKSWSNVENFSAYSRADQWGTGNYQSGGNLAGSVTDQSVSQRRIQQDFSVAMSHKFGDFNTNLIIGSELWERSSNSQTDGNTTLYIPNFYNTSSGASVPTASQGISVTRLIGAFADVSANYKDFLFIHGSYRRDFSSLINTSYDVYGVDAAYVFSDNIAMFKKSKVFSFGKLRAGYSSTGQITVGPYSTVNTFGNSGGFPYSGPPSLSISSTYNNPGIVPEKTIEKEVGLELGFFKNKVNLSATYYQQNSTNQLFGVTITSASGYTSALINAAESTDEGLEFDLKFAPLVKSKSGFRWDFATNFAINTTTVTSLAGTSNYGIGNANAAIVNMAFPQIYTTDLLRDAATGKVIVDSKTGYPSLAPASVAAGRTTPKYILGFTQTFSYKNLTLQMVADYRGGYVFYNNSELNLDFTGASAHTATNGRQNFIYPNSVIADPANAGKYIANTNVYTQDGNIGFWVSSKYRSAGTSYVENAAAWKLRSVTLTYDFTKLLAKNMTFFKGATLSVIGNDLIMLRPKENDFTDPEFTNGNSNAQGYNTYFQLPPTRKFSFVLAFKF